MIRMIFTVIVCVALSMSLFVQHAVSASDNCWSYRKSHTIQSSAGAGMDYQVRITVHYGAGADAGEIVYLDGKCEPDFGDVRFIANDGVTELSYWMETKLDGDNAVFWVKINDDLSSVSNQIYVYYGNSLATDMSDGDRTFIFFDDFNGPLNTAKWELQRTVTTGGGVTYPRTEPVAAENYLRNGGGFTSGTYGWTCAGSQPSYDDFQDNAVEFRYRVAANAISEVSFRGDFAADTGYKGRSDQRNNEGQSFLKPPYTVGGWNFIPGAGADGARPDANVWYRGTITALGANFNYYRDGVLRRSATDAEYSGPGQISLQNHYGAYTDYDWVAVRKFVDPQPAHGAWGVEEENAACSARLRYALSFNGIDNHVEVNDAGTLDLSNQGTLEAWIYISETNDGATLLHKGDGQEAYSLRFGVGADNDKLMLVVNDGSNTDAITGAKSLSLNKWHHVAGTWNNTVAADDMAIYINGILDVSGDCQRDAQNSPGKLIIGARDDSASDSFKGRIDEPRVWSTTRTPDQIRETMCKKLLLPSPSTELVGYWRFDEIFSSTCLDYSGNGNTGFTPAAARICSSAPIGDASFPDYSPGYSAALSAGDESLTATIDADSVVSESGIHVYRVNEAPDDRYGPIGTRLFADRGYWGVFITGGTSPEYKVEYNYDVSDDTIPGVGDESGLRLTFRHGNCETWKALDAVPDTGANTLTKEGMNGTEYLLGVQVAPRNAIAFDGVDDYVDCGNDASLNGLGALTYEAWIYPTEWEGGQGGTEIRCVMGKGTNLAIADRGQMSIFKRLLGTTPPAIPYMVLRGRVITDDGPYNVTTTTMPPLDAWTHVALVFDGVSLKIYYNGFLVETNGPFAPTPLVANTASFRIGNDEGRNAALFSGRIDEVRIWTEVRDEISIRYAMCRKLNPDVDIFTNLAGYWRFDEETQLTACPDYSGKGNTGTMNAAAFGGDAAIRAARVCSSAPIGDASAYDYNAGSSSVSLLHSDGDSLMAVAVGGDWTSLFSDSGIHVYRVDEPPVYSPDLWDDKIDYFYMTPNGMTPPDGPPPWSSLDYYRYWGVFLTDWTSGVNEPVYDVAYYYEGNPMVPANADGAAENPELGLARRDDYCMECRFKIPPDEIEIMWEDSGATWEVAPQRLVVSDDNQNQGHTDPDLIKQHPEYILAGKNQPLAIDMASFTAGASDGCVEIEWETATEIDTTGFYLWRSDQKDGEYTRITESRTDSVSVMATKGARYAYTDCEVDFTLSDEYYYKLQEEVATRTTSPQFHGPIGPVSETVSASLHIVGLSPAPSTRSSSKSGCFIHSLMD